jgi:molybdopterin synthase sulfur carrier subunit
MADPITLDVLLFAGVRAAVGAPSVRVSLPAGSTVAALRAQLAALHAALREQHGFMIAVNEEFAEDSVVLSGRDEVAVIPPVSGG